MKIVHYEYRLKAYTSDGAVEVQLVAKQIKHYSDVIEFLPSGELMPVKHARPRKERQVASRYLFGVAGKGLFNAAETDDADKCIAYKSSAAGNYKKSWNTCIRRYS